MMMPPLCKFAWHLMTAVLWTEETLFVMKIQKQTFERNKIHLTAFVKKNIGETKWEIQNMWLSLCWWCVCGISYLSLILRAIKIFAAVKQRRRRRGRGEGGLTPSVKDKPSTNANDVSQFRVSKPEQVDKTWRQNKRLGIKLVAFVCICIWKLKLNWGPLFVNIVSVSDNFQIKLRAFVCKHRICIWQIKSNWGPLFINIVSVFDSLN